MKKIEKRLKKEYNRACEICLKHIMITMISTDDKNINSLFVATVCREVSAVMAVMANTADVWGIKKSHKFSDLEDILHIPLSKLKEATKEKTMDKETIDSILHILEEVLGDEKSN